MTLGPIEWDLALLGPESVAAYDAAPALVGVRPSDPDTQRALDAARMLQLIACLALVPQMPALADGLAPSIEHWRRAMPFAGGR